MPRYFFDTIDTVQVIDTVGANLADIQAARDLAFATVSEILRDVGRSERPARCQAIVRDESGDRLFTITGSVAEEAA